MINIGLISLGCSKNTVDSEAILALFDNENFKIVNKLDECDCIIVNTCGFILDAKKEAIETIFEVLNYKRAKIVVCGCLVERYLEELKKEIPEVDLWISFKDYPRFATLVSSLFDISNSSDFDIFNRVLSTKPYTAFLKISEGCSNFCGFCAIPYIRGRFHSFDFDSLINEAKHFAKNGVKELVVVSQDTGRYGFDLKDKNINLLTLLKELVKIDGIEFIRLLYLYPEEVSDELIDFINNSPKMTHYFDIPIQHISNKILKSMNRRDTKESIIQLFDKIKSKVKDPIFRTTIIVGYPGETDEDIEELKDFINQYHFNHLGVFTYSKEEGTYGAKLPNQIDEDLKNKRKEDIMQTQASISYIENKNMIGKKFKAIITDILQNNEYHVRCGYNAPDEIDGNIILKANKNHKEGDIINIEITHAFVYDLFAKEA